jgi:hypothetical protein
MVFIFVPNKLTSSAYTKGIMFREIQIHFCFNGPSSWCNLKQKREAYVMKYFPVSERRE